MGVTVERGSGASAFGNAGGPVWQAVLPSLNRYARVPVCGLIALYNGVPQTGRDWLGWPATDSDDTTFSLISSAVHTPEDSGNPMSSAVAADCRTVRCNRIHLPWLGLESGRPCGWSARSS